MNKQKHIKIPLPNWRWWQIAITIVFVILALRVDQKQVFDLLKISLERCLKS
jgi:hypothetical protein